MNARIGSGRSGSAAYAAAGALLILLATGCGPDPRYSEPVERPAAQSPQVSRPVQPAPPAQPPAAAAPTMAEMLWPRQPGDTWEMARTTDAGSDTLLVQVTGSRTDAGITAFTVDTRRGNEVLQSEGYVADASGVSRVSAGADGGGQIDPPMPMLRLPFKPSDAWAWQGRFLAGATETRAKAKFYLKPPEPVRTKAGLFQAYKLVQVLTLDLPGGAQTIQTTMWLAPGVGLVKQETSGAGSHTSAELIRYQVKKASASSRLPTPWPNGRAVA